VTPSQIKARMTACYTELEAVDRILEQVISARTKLRLAFRELQALERGMSEVDPAEARGE
jgi:hypothetical protein